jgi:hypothetical protein
LAVLGCVFCFFYLLSMVEMSFVFYFFSGALLVAVFGVLGWFRFADCLCKLRQASGKRVSFRKLCAFILLCSANYTPYPSVFFVFWALFAVWGLFSVFLADKKGRKGLNWAVLGKTGLQRTKKPPKPHCTYPYSSKTLTHQPQLNMKEQISGMFCWGSEGQIIIGEMKTLFDAALPS